MDETTARQALQQAYAYLGQGRVSVIAGATTTPILYSDISRRLDIDGAIAAAFNVGRTGSAMTKLVQVVQTASGGQDITPTVLFDQAALSQKLMDAANASRVVVTNARAIRTKTGFDTVAAKDGQTFDATTAIPGVITGLQDVNAPADLQVQLTGTSTPPVISDMQAQLAASQATAMDADDRPRQRRPDLVDREEHRPFLDQLQDPERQHDHDQPQPRRDREGGHEARAAGQPRPG